MHSTEKYGAAQSRAPGRHIPTLWWALCCAGMVAMLATPGQAAGASTDAASSKTEAASDGSAPPASTTRQEPGLQKVGEARLRFLLWSVYDSRLYTPTGSYTQGERPLRLEIEYLINVKSAALVDRTAREWEAMGREHPRQDKWLQRLDRLWPNVDKRDVLTLEVDENDVSTFFHNGERLGQIEDPAFGEQFLAIWLSKDSSRPSLRQELIGMTELN